jgi:hypothetical protein
MATVTADEQQGETSPQEKSLSTISTRTIVLEGIPSSPDELCQLIHKEDAAYFPTQKLQEDNANQHHPGDALPKDLFVDSGNPTPTISRSSTYAARTHPNLGLGVEIDRGLTPPLSILRKSESSSTSDHLQIPIEVTSGHSSQESISKPTIATEISGGQKSLLNTAAHQRPGGNLKESGGAENSKTNKRREIPSIPEIQEITILGGGCCFVANVLLAPAEDRTHWTAILKSRVDQTLLQELPYSIDNQSSVAVTLCMAGTRKTDLKPSILVTCCGNRKRGKAVEKIMSRLNKMGGLRGPPEPGSDADELPYHVWVQGGFDLLMEGPKLEEPTVEAKIPDSPTTMCGVSARIRSPPILGAGGPEVKFTLGGMIQINHQMYLLTAGHPFLPSGPPADDDSESSSSSTLGDEPDSNTIEDHNTGVESNDHGIALGETDPAPRASQDLVFKSFEHGGIFSRVNSPYTSQLGTASTQTLGTADWALFLAGDSDKYYSPQAPNSILLPGHSVPIVIEGIMAKSEFCEDEVWVATGSGLHYGVLDPTPASILLHNSICEVRKIALASPLGNPTPFHGKSLMY